MSKLDIKHTGSHDIFEDLMNGDFFVYPENVTETHESYFMKISDNEAYNFYRREKVIFNNSDNVYSIFDDNVKISIVI